MIFYFFLIIFVGKLVWCVDIFSEKAEPAVSKFKVFILQV